MKRRFGVAIFILAFAVAAFAHEDPIFPVHVVLTVDPGELTAVVRMEMVQRSRKRYKIVSAPGPGVLKLEFEIIDIKPFVWLTKPDGTRYFRTDTVLKGSKFEVDCKDSVTGERIFALSTMYGGDDYLAYQDPWLLNNVEKAFNEWLAFLRERMDEIDFPAKK